MFTLFSLLFSVLLLFLKPQFLHEVHSSFIFGVSTTFVATVMFGFFLMTRVLTLSPLQKAEQNFTPRILTLYSKDPIFTVVFYWLVTFLLGSCLIFIGLLFLSLSPFPYLVLGWLVGLGITFDLLILFSKERLAYLDPFSTLKKFVKMGETAARTQNEGELCDWIEAIAETGLKALDRKSLSLTHASIRELREISRVYLSVAKIFFTSVKDEEAKEEDQTLQYVLFFLFHRLESIHKKAIELNLDLTSSEVISTLGKITLDSAKYDLSIISYPLLFLNRFALEAVKKGMQDVGIKATYTILEVGKSIIQEMDLRYLNLRDPFSSLITYLHEITQELFKHDKSMSLSVLKEPFLNMKEEFETDKLKNHKDTPEMISDINAVLAEYDTLESVLRTIPSISEIEKESTPPKKKDLPKS